MKPILKVFCVLLAGTMLIFTGCGDDDNGGDACDGVNCQANASCVQGDCVCNTGFHAEGEACVENDPCDGVDCSADPNSECVDGDCVCKAGYEDQGGTCVEVTDPCADVDCSADPNSECDPDTATCVCKDGYILVGDSCVEGTDVCEGHTCQDNAHCIEQNEQPVCVCDSGYIAEGDQCVEIVFDPCDGVDCSGHGTCEVVNDAATCNCEAGYQPIGLNCVSEANPCEGIDCCGHGTCEEAGGTPSCNCDDGYNDDDGDLQCGPNAPDPWPPTDYSTLWNGSDDPDQVACTLPECDECGYAGDFDPTGFWTRTSVTTTSNCGAIIMQFDPRTDPDTPNPDEPDQILGFITGSCSVDDVGVQVGTIIDGTISSCSINPQDMDVTSIELGNVTYSGDSGTGTAHVYLINVPVIAGGDCDFEMELTYTRQ